MTSALLRQAIVRFPKGSLGGLQQFRFATTEPDSHDDFKPKLKAPATGDVESQIKEKITTSDVHVFMKGTPDRPQCGFSRNACLVLNAYGVQFGATDVLSDADVREGIKKFTSWPTIPQVFVKGEFIGGADILMGMHDSGELEKLLAPIRKAQGGK